MGLKLIAVFLVGLFFAPGVSAEAHCGDRASTIEILEKKYKEQLVANGISMFGELVELFVSSQVRIVGNTWTITATDPRTQILCLVSSGAVWLDVVSIDSAQ